MRRRVVVIDGVRIKEIRDIVDARGALQVMVRADETEFFERFGEVYFSITNPGAVKAWHRQMVQTNLLSCILGNLQLALYDDRETSTTKGELQLMEFGDRERKLVRVPPGVIYGWHNRGEIPAILANCASGVHDPQRSEKIDSASGRVPHVW
jgi:dTDP-4-dehydrorhamnose 3,5-epimerase